jgi:hypothetical protein
MRPMRVLRPLAVAVAFMAAHAVAVSGQSLRDQCSTAAASGIERCRAVADAALITQARVGVSLAGGNPTAGTASTLGMRLGSMPRLSLGARVTAARADTPDFDFTAASLSLDAAVGVYQGMSLLPTVGGFGSIDVLGSVGVMPLPSGSAYDGAPASWALGARVGILRESFTAPGVSVSAMYRSIGGFSRGNPDVPGMSDSYLRLSDQRVTSLRIVAGKRLFGVGLAGGAGHDRFRADALARGNVPVGGLPDARQRFDIEQSGLRQNRNSLFLNASLTMLILNVSAEAGWQQGGERGTTGGPELGRGGLFGGVAARVTL